MERLSMHQIRDMIYRLRKAESDRQIAQDLRLSRHTVQKYRRLAEEHGYLTTELPLPAEKDLHAALGPPIPPPRPDSSVGPYQAVVERLLDDGVELTAMLARLHENHGNAGSYSSLRRFVQQLRPSTPEVCARVLHGPGEEGQVDFGPIGALVDPASGVARAAFAFVLTLAYSRHQYAELIFDQKIPTWIGCHRRAFESFGGVPRRIVPDNLKAAVIEVNLHDPVLGEAYRRMAQHYGFLISPTRPRTPEHNDDDSYCTSLS